MISLKHSKLQQNEKTAFLSIKKILFCLNVIDYLYSGTQQLIGAVGWGLALFVGTSVLYEIVDKITEYQIKPFKAQEIS